MPPSDPLQRFVDDELQRAPLLFDRTMDGTLDELKRGAGNALLARGAAMELIEALQRQRRRMAERFAASLRRRVESELARSGSGAAAADGAGIPVAAPMMEFSLLDEEAVAADVETTHVAATIRTVAEHELRELLAFTTALHGEEHVARDNNPFRADTMARALCDAAQELALPHAHRLGFMRAAGNPLAQALRKSYAAACARIEDEGIEPAMYRTVIVRPGTRAAQRFDAGGPPDASSETAAAALEMPSETVSALLGAPEVPVAAATEARPASLRGAATVTEAGTAEMQPIELVGRLFEGIAADPRTPADLRPALARLHSPVLRVALSEPEMLDNPRHPAWQFMDRIVFLVEPELGLPDAERQRALRYAEGLIENLVGRRVQDATPFRWALDRIAVFERQRLERRLARCEDRIRQLEQLDRQLAQAGAEASLTAAPDALDVGHLATVPADLFEALPGAPAAAWLDERQPGDWARLFMHGGWIAAQLLWRAPAAQIWLWSDAQDGEQLALRRRALERLYAEGMLKTLVPRSLVRDAAELAAARLRRDG